MLNTFSPTSPLKPKGRKPLCRRAFHARVTGDDRPKQKSLRRDPFFNFRYKVFTCIHLSPAHARMAKSTASQTPAQADKGRRIATPAQFARCPLAHNVLLAHTARLSLTALPTAHTVHLRSAFAVVGTHYPPDGVHMLSSQRSAHAVRRRLTRRHLTRGALRQGDGPAHSLTPPLTAFV